MLITVHEIRDHLRLDDDSHDGELRAMYAAALDYCEQYLERSIPWDTDTESQVFPRWGQVRDADDYCRPV